jgi:hypothetical protein
LPRESDLIKVWYQSFVDPARQSAYCKTLTQSLTGMTGKGVRFDVHGIVPPDLELQMNGVEVIIPASGLPSLLFSRIKNFTIGNALALNCIAVLAKMTEAAVALNRYNGTGASRLATYQKPSAKGLREFLES